MHIFFRFFQMFYFAHKDSLRSVIKSFDTFESECSHFDTGFTDVSVAMRLLSQGFLLVQFISSVVFLVIFLSQVLISAIIILGGPKK